MAFNQEQEAEDKPVAIALPQAVQKQSQPSKQ